MYRFITLVFLSCVAVCSGLSQGFLRVNNQDIVNNNGPFILRSIGTGNWMIQEGYMMQSTGVDVNTHTQFRTKLNATMGVERTNAFYEYWLDSHLTKADLDSMKSWGFNAVRPALHYLWFTLPIEKEEKSVDGSIQNTWLVDGFERLDSLVRWCADNQMYVIFDMHGTPGGQGKDANISDYAPTLPSLWESADNQDKLVALWVKIAERYKDNPWVGGYDLINEPNWNVDQTGNKNGCGCETNTAIWDLHLRLTKAIREVDHQHIIYISGNCWGNNYNGFADHALNGYDDNTVLTFHKYWNSNHQSSIQWAIDMRKQHNMPLWMSESGENSNHWFAEAIELFEKNNIGWSWWPVKKSRLNNVLKVTTNDEYYKLLDSWKKGNTPLSAEATYKAVMGYAKAHQTQSCTVATDVIFALNSGTNPSPTQAYRKHIIGEWIQCVHYDLGKDGFAYHDIVSENIHEGDNKWAKWNTGNEYRNDGVDIAQYGEDYYVGWTEEGEWLQYTIDNVRASNFNLELLSSSADTQGVITVSINQKTVAKNVALPVTGEQCQWKTTTIKDILLPQGECHLRIKIEVGGSNLMAFRLVEL
ncbi:cellulase family glycosylhydrolase [Carboxylicivirga sp. A043]|uniref:cellulase family glycosylhydrolase n=1 Tax=Carboxylicivirga litoralis TaxID=2816963 RepID=UPI0021CB45A1|nr:cellulase family glycosylhydrolase [Carboxylicivirga sp. A043]MCU4156445.1 cellulase family glycosylhydrolase [Carboxylicivirga sp. A043]